MFSKLASLTKKRKIAANYAADRIKQTMKLRPDLWDNYSLPYDIYSITHFGPYAFSAFGGVTVMDK